MTTLSRISTFLLALAAVTITLAFAACNNSGEPSTPGTGRYAAYTYSTVGPGIHPHPATIRLMTKARTEAARLTTDSLGNGAIDVATGTYTVLPVIDNDTMWQHTVVILDKITTIDSINYCPICK